MQHVVDTLTSSLAVTQVANITLDERKSLPLLRSDQSSNLVQIMLVAGSKVVQTNNDLVHPQQML